MAWAQWYPARPVMTTKERGGMKILTGFPSKSVGRVQDISGPAQEAKARGIGAEGRDAGSTWGTMPPCNLPSLQSEGTMGVAQLLA